MRIELKLFFNFATYLPPGSSKQKADITLEDDLSVQALVEMLQLPPEIPKTILVNGLKAQEDTVLQEGDSVAIFPPMAGG